MPFSHCAYNLESLLGIDENGVRSLRQCSLLRGVWVISLPPVAKFSSIAEVGKGGPWVMSLRTELTAARNLQQLSLSFLLHQLNLVSPEEVTSSTVRALFFAKRMSAETFCLRQLINMR